MAWLIITIIVVGYFIVKELKKIGERLEMTERDKEAETLLETDPEMYDTMLMAEHEGKRKREAKENSIKKSETVHWAGHGVPKIMIFDADSFVRQIYERAFAKAGFAVKLFPDYENVLKIVAKWRPDILCCDIIVPGDIIGYDAIKLLKKDKRTKDIPIIVVSNLGQKEDAEKALKLGAERYYIKAHYTPSEVVEAFIDVLASKNQQKQGKRDKNNERKN